MLGKEPHWQREKLWELEAENRRKQESKWRSPRRKNLRVRNLEKAKLQGNDHYFPTEGEINYKKRYKARAPKEVIKPSSFDKLLASGLMRCGNRAERKRIGKLMGIGKAWGAFRKPEHIAGVTFKVYPNAFRLVKRKKLVPIAPNQYFGVKTLMQSISELTVKVAAHTVAFDLVPVQSIEMPSQSIQFLDMAYQK